MQEQLKRCTQCGREINAADPNPARCVDCEANDPTRVVLGRQVGVVVGCDLDHTKDGRALVTFRVRLDRPQDVALVDVFMSPTFVGWERGTGRERLVIGSDRTAVGAVANPVNDRLGG